MTRRTDDTVTDTNRPADPSPGRIEAAFRELDGDPRFAWTGRRRNRLLLIAAQAGFLVLAFALLAVDQPLMALLAFLPFFPLMSFINLGIHGVLELPVARLDDVMVRLRTEARAQAYGILVGIVAALFPLALVVAAVVDEIGDVSGAARMLLSVTAALLLVAILLPRWVLAWRLPDPDLDDAHDHPMATEDGPSVDRSGDHAS